jgi:hypothetical protein
MTLKTLFRRPCRHLSHATVDIPVETLPVAGKLWNETIKARVSKALAVNFGFEPQDIIPIDVFVVKYSAGEQKELSVHRSVSVAGVFLPACGCWPSQAGITTPPQDMLIATRPQSILQTRPLGLN